MNCANLILNLSIYNSRNRLGRFLKLFPIKSYRLEGLRTLYSSSSLGLDEFSNHNIKIKQEYGDTNLFLNQLERLEYENKDIHAKDLKVLIACCETDRSLSEYTIKLFKRYNDHVNDLHLKPFRFGPQLMRLFHINDSVDEALELILDEEYGKFFRQISSYNIIMDKLFKLGKYEEVKFLMNKIISEELFDIPWSCLTLTMGANYKIGTEEALEHSMKLMHLIVEKKKTPQMRTIAFAAGLALKMEKTDAALEILEYSRKLTPFLLFNLRVLVKARLGFIDDVIAILNDVPNSSNYDRKAFCYDVFEEVEKIVNKTEDLENMDQIKHLKNVFESSNLISSQSLDEVICRPIERRPEENTKSRSYRTYEE